MRTVDSKEACVTCNFVEFAAEGVFKVIHDFFVIKLTILFVSFILGRKCLFGRLRVLFIALITPAFQGFGMKQCASN